METVDEFGYDNRGIDVTTEGRTGGRRWDGGSWPEAADVELQWQLAVARWHNVQLAPVATTLKMER